MINSRSTDHHDLSSQLNIVKILCLVLVTCQDQSYTDIYPHRKHTKEFPPNRHRHVNTTPTCPLPGNRSYQNVHLKKYAKITTAGIEPTSPNLGPRCTPRKSLSKKTTWAVRVWRAAIAPNGLFFWLYVERGGAG